MAPAMRPKTSRQKVAAHRQRLRKQGLRPIQIWVPDVRAPGFAEEAHRQSLAVAQEPACQGGSGLHRRDLGP